MNRFYSTCTVMKECGVSARQLYYWELIGLLSPQYERFGARRFRRYTREDMDLVKNAKILLDEGFTLRAVKRRLAVSTAGYRLTDPAAAADPELIGHPGPERTATARVYKKNTWEPLLRRPEESA